MYEAGIAALTDDEVIALMRQIVADDERREAESLALLPPW